MPLYAWPASDEEEEEESKPAKAAPVVLKEREPPAAVAAEAEQEEPIAEQPPAESEAAGQDEDAYDRRITALLLREAKQSVQQAEEEGHSAYTLGVSRAPPVSKSSERLLKGEISQVCSHNRRRGVDAAALPKPEGESFTSNAEREAAALERDYVVAAHQLRFGGFSMSSKAVKQVAASRPKKRQRVGADGHVIDIRAVEAEEDRLAEADVEMAHPLLRPPPGAVSNKKKQRQRELAWKDRSPSLPRKFRPKDDREPSPSSVARWSHDLFDRM
mmetsp:Transcript_44768/g.106276  ORF Transcript_44768/g.106276 Transcript_44768/m.106276 type:complete len:273 (+) Transcript_44768:123-941(+)